MARPDTRTGWVSALHVPSEDQPQQDCLPVPHDEMGATVLGDYVTPTRRSWPVVPQAMAAWRGTYDVAGKVTGSA